MKVVVRGEPFQRTVEPKTKLEPLTFRLKPGAPAVWLVGEIELSEGEGLLTVPPQPANARIPKRARLGNSLLTRLTRNPFRQWLSDASLRVGP